MAENLHKDKKKRQSKILSPSPQTVAEGEVLTTSSSNINATGHTLFHQHAKRELYAEKQPKPAEKRCKRSVVKKKCGRKRRGRSMGRFPFVTYINKYVVEYEPYLAKSTIDEQARKLRYIGRTLQQLKEEDRIDTVDPRKISEKEVREYMKWMDRHGMETNGKVKYLQAFNNLLRFCDNSTIDKMRKKRLLPKKKLNEINTLTEEEIEHIINSTSKISGWRGVKAKFMCAMYPYTGLRPQELRLAHLEDLDVKKWEFWVRNPKGKNRYGVQRTVPIPPPIRTFIHDFLHERKEYLDSKGIFKCEPLIPKVTIGKVDFYSSHHFRQLKKEISECSGINFSLKTFRASFAQILKDRGVSIETISKLMGHHTTKTTETFYARIKDTSAFAEINSIWSKPSNAKKCEIELLAR